MKILDLIAAELESAFEKAGYLSKKSQHLFQPSSLCEYSATAQCPLPKNKKALFGAKGGLRLLKRK